MDSKNVRKWFVYMGDHHEGPFSIPEIQAKMMQRLITPENHVWCEGMADWITMRDVQDFSPAIEAALDGLTQVTGAGAGLTGSTNFTGTQQTSTSTQQDFSPHDADESDADPEMQTMGSMELDEEPSGAGSMDPTLALAPDADEFTETNPSPMGTQPVPTPTPDAAEGELSNQLSSDQQKAAGFTTGEFQAGSPDQVVRNKNAQGLAQEISLKGIDKSDATDMYEDATGMGLSPEQKARIEKEKRERAKEIAKEQKKRAKEAKLLGLADGDDFAGEISHRRKIRRLAYLAGFVVVVALLGQVGALGIITDSSPYKTARKTLRSVINKIPVINQFVASISHIEGMSEVDMADLLKVAESDLMEERGRMDVAIALEDPSRPKLYLASNLPEGASFTVIVKGRPGTLLNRFSYERRYQMVLEDPVVELAEAIDLPGGGMVPQGSYDIIAFESKDQPETVKNALELLPVVRGSTPAHQFLPKGRRLFIAKRYFLGGKNDEAYQKRLRQWNSNALKASKKEIKELRNFHSLISSENKASSARFDKVSRFYRNPKTKAAWEKFANKSVNVRNDLKDRFNTWDTTKYLYSGLYGRIKKSGLLYLELFQVYSEYLGTEERNSKEELDAIKSKTEGMRKKLKRQLSRIKSDIARADRLKTKGKNGFPVSEGL